VFSVLVRQGLCVWRVKSLCISGIQRRVFSFSGHMRMCLKDLQRFCRLYIGRDPGEFHYMTEVMCRGLSKLAFQPGGDWGVSPSACPHVGRLRVSLPGRRRRPLHGTRYARERRASALKTRRILEILATLPQVAPPGHSPWSSTLRVYYVSVRPAFRAVSPAYAGVARRNLARRIRGHFEPASGEFEEARRLL